MIGAPGNLIAQSALSVEIDMKYESSNMLSLVLPISNQNFILMQRLATNFFQIMMLEDEGAFDTEKDFSDVPAWKQWLSLIILVLTLLAMIFEDKIGIKLCISGGIGALLLILTGVISEKDALKSIDLKTIFLFGGTLSLAAALQETGAGELIANKVIGTLGENPSPYMLTFVVFILCCILTSFCVKHQRSAFSHGSNLSVYKVQGMGADPRRPYWMACVIGGSCAYATPIGMPANTMVVGAGGYKFMDYVKSGFVHINHCSLFVSMIILQLLSHSLPEQ
ncbi:MAG: SLC13 family permease [Eubacterium ramulus]